MQIVAGAELKSLSPETENYHLLDVTVTSTRVQVRVPRPTRPRPKQSKAEREYGGVFRRAVVGFS